MTEINLTAPCPLCSLMLKVVYEPDDGREVPLVVDVQGCKHAEDFMGALDGKRASLMPLEDAYKFYDALHHAAEIYQLDEWADWLEQSARRRRLN